MIWNSFFFKTFADTNRTLSTSLFLDGGPSSNGEGSREALLTTWSEFGNPEVVSLFTIDGAEVAYNVVQQAKVVSIIGGRPIQIIDQVVCVKSILDGGAPVYELHMPKMGECLDKIIRWPWTQIKDMRPIPPSHDHLTYNHQCHMKVKSEARILQFVQGLYTHWTSCLHLLKKTHTFLEIATIELR